MNPRDVVPESVMPNYPSLAETELDGALVQKKMQVLKDWFNHPYTDDEITNAPNAVAGRTEMDAVIAYLQNLGTAIKTVR